MLVTTRAPGLGRRDAVPNIDTRPLHHNNSAKLLTALPGQKYNVADQEKLATLLDQLGHLSLATNNTATSFNLSINRLSEIGIDTSTALEVLEYLQPDAIPDIIDAALKQKISKTLPSDAFGIATLLLYQAFPKQHPFRTPMTEMWEECEKYAPHVINFHEQFVKKGKTVEPNQQSVFCELLYNCSCYLLEQGRFDTSLEISLSAEKVCEKANIKDGGLLLADIYTIQGTVHIELNKNINTATNLFQKALEIREDAVTIGIMDPNHPNRANSFMNMGNGFSHSDPQKTIELHERAIETRRNGSRPPKREDSCLHLAVSYLCIGKCHLKLGNSDDALASFKKCLEELEVSPKGNGSLKSTVLGALGNIQIERGNMEDALISWTEAMEVSEKYFGRTHVRTAYCYYKIGWLAYKRSDYKQAIAFINLALGIYNGNLPHSTVRTEIARAKFVLALALDNTSFIEEARKNRQEARELKFSITGKIAGQEDTVQDYDNLIADHFSK
ncbi:hypothetical protein TWF730_010035 [Orbilia blumenaviensis]|uniref:Uncharacterized protein n=1 Tax=Orbilia blumenaviensis TaxID=1796055 RepID=A0AAV9V039_9PEZI